MYCPSMGRAAAVANVNLACRLGSADRTVARERGLGGGDDLDVGARRSLSKRTENLDRADEELAQRPGIFGEVATRPDRHAAGAGLDAHVGRPALRFERGHLQAQRFVDRDTDPPRRFPLHQVRPVERRVTELDVARAEDPLPQQRVESRRDDPQRAGRRPVEPDARPRLFPIVSALALDPAGDPVDRQRVADRVERIAWSGSRSRRASHRRKKKKAARTTATSVTPTRSDRRRAASSSAPRRGRS